jgi:hypothetical protein
MSGERLLLIDFVAIPDISGPLWILVILGGFCALVGLLLILLLVVLPPLIFLVACFEKLTVDDLVFPKPGEAIPQSPALAMALNSGFELIGHFADRDKGFKRSLVSLALSSDRLVLFLVVHGKLGGKIVLNTRYQGSHWLVTASSGMTDLSGLDIREEMMLPFQLLHENHRTRMAAMGEKSMPFLANCLLNDYAQHHRDKIDAMAKMGLARFTSAQRTEWKYTVKGAFRIMIEFYRDLSASIKRSKLAQKQKMASEWGLNYDSEQFLVSDAPPPGTRSMQPPAPVSPAAVVEAEGKNRSSV